MTNSFRIRLISYFISYLISIKVLPSWPLNPGEPGGPGFPGMDLKLPGAGTGLISSLKILRQSSRILASLTSGP